MSECQVEKVNLSRKLDQFAEHWRPRVVGELNGQHVKLAKLEGEFVWHHHEHEDELFLVIRGRLAIHLRDRVVELDEGEFFIVPRGVEHKPVADSETHVLLLEPAPLGAGWDPARAQGLPRKHFARTMRTMGVDTGRWRRRPQPYSIWQASEP
jgi:mannose-6-phosphate isomerase-like protein (cupin superfamily)